MLDNYLNRPRRKAWIGAAIGAAASIGSAIFGASQQRKAQQKQLALQRNAQAREAGIQSAMNLTQAYANYDELDEEFRNRFFRYGGRRKAEAGTEEKKDDNTSSNSGSSGSSDSGSSESSGSGSSDTNSSSSSSGFSGIDFNYEWSNKDTDDIIGGVGSAVGDIASSLIRNNVHRSGETFIPIKTAIKPVGNNKAVYDSAARSNFLNNYYRTSVLRCGGVKMRRK